MLPRAVALALALALALLLPGCALPGLGDDDAPPATGPTSVTPPEQGPPLVFGGTVLDAATGEPLPDARVRLDLAQTRPCRNVGLVWTSWPLESDASGRFGPLVVQRPRSNDVAFVLRAEADGYTARLRYIGPQDARGDLGNLTLALHPAANVSGTAPPATVVALEDDDDWPRFAVADDAGRFAFRGARANASQLVAATDAPHREAVAAPADVVVPATNASAWRLEGRLVRESGAPIAGQVAAWNDTTLWSAAIAGENGVFVLPLDALAVPDLRVAARTADGALGATKVIDLKGEPATRETLLMRALC